MLPLFRTKIKIVHCKVPKQPNAHDCGVYVVKFAKMVLDAMPRTSSLHLRDDLQSQLDQTAFTQSDVDAERRTIRALIERYLILLVARSYHSIYYIAFFFPLR
jgi:Ulp1 family protease